MKWAVLSSLHALSVHFEPPSLQERFILSFRTTWGEQLWESGKKQAVIINCKGLFSCKWILTGWGRRTGNASPPASPSGHPAGSYGCTALSRTCSRFLQKETHIRAAAIGPRDITRCHILKKTRNRRQREREAAGSTSLLWRGWVSERRRDAEERQRQRNWEGKWVSGLKIDRDSVLWFIYGLHGSSSCADGTMFQAGFETKSLTWEIWFVSVWIYIFTYI